METLHNGFTLDTPAGTFPLSTDSILLASFAVLPKNARVLDLGSGCGTLGLLLCADHPQCHVTGVEIAQASHQAAVQNIQANALQPRMKSICADLRTIHQLFPAGQFDCCISNPPYFSGGPASAAAPAARREDLCDIRDLFQSAAWALKYGGNFFLVHRPERLAELCAQASLTGLEPKRLCLVRHRPGKNISLILLACRKGAKPGLVLDELCLFDAAGQPTDQYKTIYHL